MLSLWMIAFYGVFIVIPGLLFSMLFFVMHSELTKKEAIHQMWALCAKLNIARTRALQKLETLHANAKKGTSFTENYQLLTFGITTQDKIGTMVQNFAHMEQTIKKLLQDNQAKTFKTHFFSVLKTERVKIQEQNQALEEMLSLIDQIFIHYKEQPKQTMLLLDVYEESIAILLKTIVYADTHALKTVNTEILSVILAEIKKHKNDANANQIMWAKNVIKQEAQLLSTMKSGKVIEYKSVEDIMA